jgi:hypothetical protein
MPLYPGAIQGLRSGPAAFPAMQISTPWQWRGMNEYSGISAAQQMPRCGLTIASLPLDSKAPI